MARWLTAHGVTAFVLKYRGFALKRQGLPSDGWIDRFWEWPEAEGFVPTAPGGGIRDNHSD